MRKKKSVQLITQTELDLLVDHLKIERVHVVGDATGWHALLYIKHHTGKIEVYRLLTQRNQPRVWKDLRTLLRLLKRHYNVTGMSVTTTDMPA